MFLVVSFDSLEEMDSSIMQSVNICCFQTQFDRCGHRNGEIGTGSFLNHRRERLGAGVTKNIDPYVIFQR